MSTPASEDLTEGYGGVAWTLISDLPKRHSGIDPDHGTDHNATIAVAQVYAILQVAEEIRVLRETLENLDLSDDILEVAHEVHQARLGQ